MKNAARLLVLIIGIGLVLAMPGCPRKCVRPEEPIPPPPLPEELPGIIGDIESPDPGSDFGLATIYFDLDGYRIREAESRKLEENARKLNDPAARELKVTVQGHCCPIGTAAYNMALGMRRAEAVKKALVRLGVTAGRLSTVSYGKERLVTSDPDKYEQNRRVEFRLQ